MHRLKQTIKHNELLTLEITFAVGQDLTEIVTEIGSPRLPDPVPCVESDELPLNGVLPAAARRSQLASGLISFDCQLIDDIQEFGRLPLEKPVSGKAGDRRHSAAEFVIARSNNRAVRQIRGDEFRRHREDQAGLNQWIEGVEEIGKCEFGVRVGKRRNRGLHCITRKINPLQEVSDLVSADTQCNLQDLQAADLLAQRRIQTGTALFDVSEMKCGHICDRLDVHVAGNTGRILERSAIEISIRPGNGVHPVERERLRKGSAKVRVRGAAITNVPTGIYIELQEVGEPPDIGGGSSLAALQSAELIEVHWIGALRFKVGIQEGRVTYFIQSVARDILRTIGVKVRQGYLIVIQLLVRVHLNRRVIADAA